MERMSMQNRNRKLLKITLYKLLVPDSISVETNIINEIIYNEAKVNLEPDTNHYRKGLQLFGEDEEKLQFKVPAKLKKPELDKLLVFFKIPDDECLTDTPLTLDANFVFDELLPLIQARYQSLKANNPSAINKYKLESQAILESSAINTLEGEINKAFKILIPKETTKMSSQTRRVKEGLQIMSDTLRRLQEEPTLYPDITLAADKIHAFLQYPKVKKNAALTKHLKQLIEGIKLFSLCHSTESIIANKAFLTGMRNFLKDEKFKIATSQCDVIENTLLRLASAELGKNGKCTINMGYNASRLVFIFKDINQENVQKVIKFLQDQGDQTACEGYAYRTYAHPIPKAMHAQENVMYAQSCELVDEVQCMSEKTHLAFREKLEQHGVETDGKFFHTTIFPLLKKEICSMQETDPATLQAYRDASQKYFEEQEKIIAKKQAKRTKQVIKPSFFQPNTAPVPDIVVAVPVVPHVVVADPVETPKPMM
jgi:hypothetical protein